MTVGQGVASGVIFLIMAVGIYVVGTQRRPNTTTDFIRSSQTILAELQAHADELGRMIAHVSTSYDVHAYVIHVGLETARFDIQHVSSMLHVNFWVQHANASGYLFHFQGNELARVEIGYYGETHESPIRCPDDAVEAIRPLVDLVVKHHYALNRS